MTFCWDHKGGQRDVNDYVEIRMKEAWQMGNAGSSSSRRGAIDMIDMPEAGGLWSISCFLTLRNTIAHPHPMPKPSIPNPHESPKRGLAPEKPCRPESHSAAKLRKSMVLMFARCLTGLSTFLALTPAIPAVDKQGKDAHIQFHAYTSSQSVSHWKSAFIMRGLHIRTNFVTAP